MPKIILRAKKNVNLKIFDKNVSKDLKKIPFKLMSNKNVLQQFDRKFKGHWFDVLFFSLKL